LFVPGTSARLYRNNSSSYLAMPKCKPKHFIILMIV